MKTLHVLLDFENVQPSMDELAALGLAAPMCGCFTAHAIGSTTAKAVQPSGRVLAS